MHAGTQPTLPNVSQMSAIRYFFLGCVGILFCLFENNIFRVRCILQQDYETLFVPVVREKLLLRNYLHHALINKISLYLVLLHYLSRSTNFILILIMFRGYSPKISGWVHCVFQINKVYTTITNRFK